jgi:uncharacterized protein YcaQ
MPTAHHLGETESVSADQVTAFRLARHHLATRAPAASLVDVAGEMAGAQAQVMSAAQMSLWSRTRGLRRSDVEKALWNDRSLAKVWCMRGTLHLVPSKDYAVFVLGCAGRADRDTRWMIRQGWSIEMIERLLKRIAGVLDRPRTRTEVATRLEGSFRTKRIRRDRGWGKSAEIDAFEIDGHTISVAGILFYACIRGIACSGPPRGNESTYVRPSAWFPGTRDLTVQEAEGALLRTYLRAHGPATPTDFAWWTARAIWDRNIEDLAAVDADGRTAWILREELPILERARLKGRPTVRLLPFFDSFLLGQKAHGHLVEAKHHKKVYRPQGWLSPVLLVDGRVAGVWAHASKGPRLSVTVEPFGPLEAGIRELVERECQDLGRFLEADDVQVTFASAP